MTYQIRNALIYKDEKWSIEERVGDKLFVPTDFGLHVTGASSTACWNSHVCTYCVANGVLLLKELEINLDKRNAPLLNGREPIQKGRPYLSESALVYSDVQLPIPFTGGLIIGGDWIKNLPSGVGPELSWHYEQVCELVFDQGNLIEAYDRSDAMARIRNEIAKNNGEIPITKPTGKVRPVVYEQYDALEAMINSCFKFDY